MGFSFSSSRRATDTDSTITVLTDNDALPEPGAPISRSDSREVSEHPVLTGIVIDEADGLSSTPDEAGGFFFEDDTDPVFSAFGSEADESWDAEPALDSVRNLLVSDGSRTFYQIVALAAKNDKLEGELASIGRSLSIALFRYESSLDQHQASTLDQVDLVTPGDDNLDGDSGDLGGFEGLEDEDLAEIGVKDNSILKLAEAPVSADGAVATSNEMFFAVESLERSRFEINAARRPLLTEIIEKAAPLEGEHTQELIHRMEQKIRRIDSVVDEAFTSPREDEGIMVDEVLLDDSVLSDYSPLTTPLFARLVIAHGFNPLSATNNAETLAGDATK